ncbi:MAG: rRNA ((2503)-C(2))-methyltransferase RlmN [Bacteroidota bacterium]
MEDIRRYSLPQLRVFFEQHGEKSFRAKQVYEWLWQKGARNFDEMTNLSKQTRAMLAEHFFIHSLEVYTTQKSSDGTMKFGFKLHDGFIVEGVMIPAPDRRTACISSQVGCNVGCSFCATGKLGFKRNLSAGEIFDQVVEISRWAEKEGSRLTNIVMMGQGEPLLNVDNVLLAIDRITAADGLAMSPRRLTLSTSGIVRNIKELADQQVRFNLAVSLHAANDVKRSEIMRINDTYPLAELGEALVYFHEKTGSRVTFEYLMLRGINDTLEDAQELAQYCKQLPVKINLIEYNSTDDLRFAKSYSKTSAAFLAYLESKNLIVNLRRSKGEDIDGACGQLANKLTMIKE